MTEDERIIEPVKKEIELNKNDIHKFDEFKLYIQIWQHHDTMFWNRFTTFIAVTSILITFLGAAVLFRFGILDPSNGGSLSSRISVIIALMTGVFVVIVIMWYLMLNRIFIWVNFYLEKAKASQKELNIKIFFNDNEGPKFPFTGKYRSIRVVDTLFSFFCICGLLVMLYHFWIIPYPSYSIDNIVILLLFLIISIAGTLLVQYWLNKQRFKIISTGDQD